MGRAGSSLVSFLIKALQSGKYGSKLEYEDETTGIFKISVARKGSNLDRDSVRMLEDWNRIKGRELSSKNYYSAAKQGLLMALRRSNYLKLISSSKKDSKYRFLSEEEIKDKTKSKRGQNSLLHSVNHVSSFTDDTPSSSFKRILSNNQSENLLRSEKGLLWERDSCDNRGVQCYVDHSAFNFDDCNLDHYANFVSNEKWKEVERYLYSQEESLECEPRNTELQLYRYKGETDYENEIILLFELEEEHHTFNLDNTEFIKGYPGIVADIVLLKKLLSCHANIRMLGKDRLLLILSSGALDTYVTRVISDRLVYKSSWFFIVT